MAHKITLGVIVNAPLHIRVGCVLQRVLRRPYTYMIDGDANADGLSLVGLGNDIMYVPKDSADITLADPEPVARPRQPDPRAAVLELTAGTDHAEEQLPGALGDAAECAAVQGVRDGGGHSVELITDVFNVLNLVDRDWGVQRATPSFLGDPEILSWWATTRRSNEACTTCPRRPQGPGRSALPDGACSSGRATPSEDAARRPSAGACRQGSFASQAW